MSLRERIAALTDSATTNISGLKYIFQPETINQLRGLEPLVQAGVFDAGQFTHIFPEIKSIAGLQDLYEHVDFDEECTLLGYNDDTGLFMFEHAIITIALSAVRKVGT